MKLRARRRLRITFLVMFCLLFQQLAVAAYACEVLSPAAAASASSHCEQMAGKSHAESPLCEKHCSPDQSTPADHAQLAVPAVTLPPVEFAAVAASAAARGAFHGDVPVSRSDPPPRLRFCSLLI